MFGTIMFLERAVLCVLQRHGWTQMTMTILLQSMASPVLEVIGQLNQIKRRRPDVCVHKQQILQ